MCLTPGLLGHAIGVESVRLKALDLSRGLAATPGNISRVADATSPDAARWAFTQRALRILARAKFTHSDQMLFTREALEQASHESVALFHTWRYPKGVLVADLTVGIGADLIAFASRGPALGYELDPERAQYARHNLAAHGLIADIIEQDCMSADWPDYVWADPSRRVSGMRTLDPADFSPDPTELAKRMQNCKLAGMKLSPMLKDEYLQSLGPCVEFVSFAGECREAIVWNGTSAERGTWAVRAESGEKLPREDLPGMVQAPRQFIYEADPAAIRAHALGTLCAQYRLQALADSNGYLTGDHSVASSWFTAYESISEPAGDVRKLKSELQRLNASTPVIKTRTKAASVTQLEKLLKAKGDKELVVLAYALGKAARYVIVAKR